MVFSSPLFLYLFLPITLCVYFLLKNIKHKNYWLLFTSLIFFSWGGFSYTLILILSIILNYFLGLKIYKNLNTSKGHKWLVAGVSINILVLCVFKYLNFLILNLNDLLGVLTIPLAPQTNIILPIGISFYTFHSLSYLVDIYRRKSIVQKNILDLSLYICMFSQLIAGPIIRYSDVSKQLRQRIHSMLKFSYGIERFLIGLGKKVLLANVFAQIADDMFDSNVIELAALNAWLGIVCYSLQIYFDFSGYSDMAIGLGKMFGFDFMENFNFPYMAKSIKDFWRRWHISLSTFFRDYVYIPLGGNQIKLSRTYFNLLIVFFLTGFWHGASWTFIVWGLLHGFFMIIERLGFEKILEKTWKPLANLYVLIVVFFLWVLFRSETLVEAINYWKAMFNFHLSSNQKIIFFEKMNFEFFLALAIGLAGAFGLFKYFNSFIESLTASNRKIALFFSYSFHLVSAVFYFFVLLVSTVYLISGTYNPFIYYKF